MEKKQKRFYKVDEVVWVIAKKREGTVQSINKDTLEVTVGFEDNSRPVTLKVWEIDKLKYKAKEELVKTKKSTKATNNDIKEELEQLKKLVHSIMHPDIYFSKLKEDAIIPSKRDEDGGWDIYTNLPETIHPDSKPVRELLLPKLQTTLIPTGLAMALPKTHYFNTKHERGSTGKITMSVLAGVIDSGYRNELFIAIAPLHKDVLITDRVEKITEMDNVILYPYSKAIAQATIDLVVAPNIKEKEYADLLKMESERGLSNLGASGK